MLLVKMNYWIFICPKIRNC